jgi:hypothetical protein
VGANGLKYMLDCPTLVIYLFIYLTYKLLSNHIAKVREQSLYLSTAVIHSSTPGNTTWKNYKHLEEKKHIGVQSQAIYVDKIIFPRKA